LKKSFFINGGAGRVLCAIPALEHYKKHVDPDVVVIAESWHELFLTSATLRYNVYPMHHKGLFQDKLKNTEIISPEPYRLNAYFNQQCNLIQAFDMLINENTEEIPESKPFELTISRDDQAFGHNTVRQIKASQNKKKSVIFQPLGSGAKMNGDFLIDDSGRSFEVKDIIKIVTELSKHYAVILMTNIDIPVQQPMGAAIPQANMLQWMGIVNACDYFLGCDSMGQHYANALGKPATVVIGSTWPQNITYPDNKQFTIIDNGADLDRRYNPFRITQDWDVNRTNEDMMILSDKRVNDIIKSVTNKLGLTKQEKEPVPMIQKAVTNISKKDKKSDVPFAVLNQQK
jgi:hypothetical protein